MLRGNTYALIGAICGFTIIGIPLTLIFLIIVWIHYRRAWRYPVIKVICPYCGKNQKIETVVTKFPCATCFETVIKVGDEWKLEDESKLKNRY